MLAHGCTFGRGPSLSGPRYLKDLPEAIKAHPARVGAAKPTGVMGPGRVTESRRSVQQSVQPLSLHASLSESAARHPPNPVQ